MRLLAPDLSADASREIEAAIRAPADKPIQLQGLVTADLTAALAAAYPKGLAYNDTVGQPYFSNGSAWLTFSLSTHTHSNVTDGDKGDITVSGGTWTIDNDAVTYAKIQNVSATDKLLGRSTAGSGDVEEIACTSAGRALIDDADASAQRTTLGLGTAATKNTGTSGNTVPLLDAGNTWSAGVTQTFAGLVDVTNGQVKFPATQNASSDANTLDDYEEGTFTPALKFGGNSTGMTYSNQAGRYTKIGRIVFMEILLVLSAKGSSTGAATITGLPFTANGSVPQPAGAMYCDVMTTVAMPMCRIIQGTATVSLYDFTGSNAVALTEADFNGTTVVVISISLTI